MKAFQKEPFTTSNSHLERVLQTNIDELIVLTFISSTKCQQKFNSVYIPTDDFRKTFKFKKIIFHHTITE